MPACERLAELSHIAPAEVERIICGSDLEERFTRGEIDGQEFTSGVNNTLELALSPEQLREIWIEAYEENLPVSRIIHQLRPNHGLVLLSNINRWHADCVMGRFEILRLFNDAVFSYQSGFVKPEEGIFKEAMSTAGSESQVLFVDDKPEYVKAACKLGMTGIVYEGSGQLRESLVRLGCRLST